MLLPEIPVGGRLSLFLKEWTKITNDQWVLSIIKEGYKLEFQQFPPKTGVKITSVPAKDLEILHLEVKELMEKSAVEYVPQGGHFKRFLQHIFPSSEKNRGHETRNKFKTPQQVSPKTTLQNGLSINSFECVVKQGDWAISLDLKDAYMHIPVFQKHRQYLRFCVKNSPCLQFSALPFGPTSAPRVFTKVVSVVAAHLRAQGIRLVVYLDDWFLVNQSSLMLVQDREIVLNLLVKLGFIINLKKSSLTPTQKITYIGALFHLDLGIVMPTQERVLKLLKNSQSNELEKTCNSQRFFTSTWNYGFLHRDDSLCKTSYETNSNLFAESLAPHFSKSGTECSNYTISKISSDLVVRYSQHYKGQIFTTLGNSCDHNNRCFYIERLGWSHGFPDSPRDLVRYTENSTYQLSRVRSCTENNTTFSSSVEREKCTSAMRQLDCCTIHKQTGGHQINSALSKKLGIC
ncbi:Hypothetical predicted protein [Mytilus galloprovincialis]|uniref:Reverse transcriptase domain-containing protein n=1 Tax=Mytilus galloprovincialis TaxID=29158 RepID=A0A8B6EZ13_MYTGA|nr:Hypothetical predicted protein [Mytilus galloprovincialis]